MRLFPLLALLVSAPTVAQTVDLALAPAADVVRERETNAVTVVAANPNASPVADVVVSVLLPAGMSSFDSPEASFECDFSCSPNETAFWRLGTLGPGEVRRIDLPIEIDRDDGVESTIVATAGSASVSTVVTSDASSFVGASVLGPGGALMSGTDATFALAYSNRRGSTLPGVTLRMRVPAEGTFVRASHGGTLNGDVVEWSIGAIGDGAGGLVEATFFISGDTPTVALVPIEAEVDPGTPGKTVGARSIWGVSQSGSPQPLRLSATASTQVFQDRETGVYLVAVSNAGSAPINDVTVDVLLPDEIGSFDSPDPLFVCDFSCSPNETARWSVGALGPGQSRTIALPVDFSSGTREGRLLRLAARGRGIGTGEVGASVDVRYDEASTTEVRVSGPDGPLRPGSQPTFTVTFSNRSATTIPGLTLRMSIPAGAVLAGATNGGARDGDEVVWTFGALGPASGGYVEADLSIPGTTPGGTLFEVHAEADPGAPGEAAHSRTARAADSLAPLAVSYLPNRRQVDGSQVTVYTLRVENVSGQQQDDVTVSVLLPDEIDSFSSPDPLFACDFSCSPNETARWTLGSLASGASRTVALPIEFSSGTRDGRLLRSTARAEALGRSPALGQIDVLFGTVVVTDAAAGPVASDHSVLAYPNPAHGRVQIEVTLGSPEAATLAVYDALGRRVAVLHDGPLASGTTTFAWLPDGLAAGPYVYRLRAGGKERSGVVVVQ